MQHKGVEGWVGMRRTKWPQIKYLPTKEGLVRVGLVRDSEIVVGMWVVSVSHHVLLQESQIEFISLCAVVLRAKRKGKR